MCTLAVYRQSRLERIVLHMMIHFHQPERLWGAWIAIGVWALCAIAAVVLLSR